MTAVRRVVSGVAIACLGVVLAATASQAAENIRRMIAVVDVESGEVTTVADEPTPEHTICGSPSWSSDGTRIVFDAITPDCNWTMNRLFVVHVAGDRKGEFDDLGYGTAPSWSPDGQHIAFTPRLGWSVPCLFDLSTGGVTPLATRCYADARLRLDATDSHVAFIAETSRGQQFQRIGVNAPAAAAATLLPADPNDGHAYKLSMLDLSVDGKRWVVLMRKVGQRSGIYLLSADGQQPAKLLISGTAKQTYSDPCWSPDGKQVAVAMSVREK